jgi:hypothetical protein
LNVSEFEALRQFAEKSGRTVSRAAYDIIRGELMKSGLLEKAESVPLNSVAQSEDDTFVRLAAVDGA